MYPRKDKEKIIALLRTGKIGILPTDTLYGIVGTAKTPSVVKRIYKIKRRSPKKPLIILISDWDMLAQFSATLAQKEIGILEKLWPGPFSVILPIKEKKKFSYLHRGAQSLAFRWPKDKWLLSIIAKSGPLVAPSANPEGLPPAKTAKEAQMYFGKEVDFYVKGRRREGPASTLIKFSKSKIQYLRRGH